MQLCGCADRTICELPQVGMFVGRQELQVERIVEVILSFDKRCTREFQISSEVRWSESTEPLSDRPRCATRGASDLFAEIEIPGRRFLGSKCVDAAL
jgi:hypothetical protein